MYKQYIIYATMEKEGRLFDHEFNITIEPDETLNADTFDKYAHIRPAWQLVKINSIQQITVEYKYTDIPVFTL